MNFRTTAAAAALILTAAFAQAATVSYASQTIALAVTDWSSFLDLQQFNPSLGQLNSVTLDLTADLAGKAQVESRSSRASTLTANLAATLTLTRPDTGQVLVVSAPLVSKVFAAAAADGVKDWAGASGKTYDNLSLSLAQTASFNDAATLALFTGTGTVSAPLSAVANSRVAGTSFYSLFETQAGGHAQVTYDYSPITSQVSSVPEPRSWALMLAGMGVLGTLARRRRSA